MPRHYCSAGDITGPREPLMRTLHQSTASRWSVDIRQALGRSDAVTRLQRTARRMFRSDRMGYARVQRAITYRGVLFLSDHLDEGLHQICMPSTTVLELLVCSCTTLGLCRVSMLRYDELVLTHGELRRAVSGPSLGTRAPVALLGNI